MQFRKTLCFVASVVALILLTGCFKTDRPLISASDADFPFNSIKYAYDGENDQVTLVKNDDGYIAPDEQGDGKLLLRSIGENTYLVQVEISDDDETIYLYAVARVAADKKSAEIVKHYASDEDRAVARSNESGLRLCPEDPEQICIDDLQKYVDFAQGSKAGSGKTLRILSLD